MTRIEPVLAIAAGVALLVASAARAELNTEQFKIRSTQDLVDLCAADPSTPLGRDGVNFCHGFVSGAWHYHQAQANGPNGERIVCPPDPPPSRTEAIAQFVTWSRAHAQYMGDAPVETLFRFLAERWPCPEPPPVAPPTKKGGKR
jgi:Ssp1 endopeptidase immunity protein Rap1a